MATEPLKEDGAELAFGYVVAHGLRGHCAQGQTIPLYLACGEAADETIYQTKIAGKRSNLSTRELCVELLGTLLAHRFGLHVAEPVVVELPLPLTEAIDTYYRFGCEDTAAFGSCWIHGTTPFVPAVEVPELDETVSAKLLALDLLLTNGDRTSPNPNVCWDGEQLLVFDFEHGFELPQGDYGKRFELHLESLSPLIASHLTASRVSQGTLLEEIANGLRNSRVVSLERLGSALPESWQTAWAYHVGYLGYIVQRSERLLERIGALTR